ncbi:hypothetical protein D3C71_678860 [compost metagenome]
MADGEIRLGDGGDDGNVRAAELGLVEGGHLARLRQHVQGALIGEGLIADPEGELHLDAAAPQCAGGIAAEIEDEGVAGAIADADQIAEVGVTAAEVPLADAASFAPVDARQIEQRQGQVSRQLELFVVPGDQIVTEPEGHLIPRTQLDGAPRAADPVDVGQCDLDLAGGDARRGLGAV